MLPNALVPTFEEVLQMAIIIATQTNSRMQEGEIGQNLGVAKAIRLF